MDRRQSLIAILCASAPLRDSMKIFQATNTLDGYLPPLEFTASAEEANVILVGGKKFSLDDFPNLKGIFKTGVGTDNLPFDEAAARGIRIALPSSSTCATIYEETSAFTCHLILSTLYAGAGVWASWKKMDRVMTANRKLLVLGTGRIGGRVAQKMGSLLRVTTFDALMDPAKALEPLIREADCISIHIPLSPDTREFFDHERLSWMKDGASLVNAARGQIIDEQALYNELACGRLRAACDVFWQEPYDGILNELPADRFIKTPHIASTCREWLDGCAADFLKFLAELDESCDSTK